MTTHEIRWDQGAGLATPRAGMQPDGVAPGEIQRLVRYVDNGSTSAAGQVVGRSCRTPQVNGGRPVLRRRIP
jgi:hypothetical protein